LKGPPLNPHRWGVAVRGYKFCGRPTIQVGDAASEVKSETQKFEYPDHMFAVYGGECPFKIQVAKDCVFLVGVCVLHTEP
jgi:hypothetical protein